MRVIAKASRSVPDITVASFRESEAPEGSTAGVDNSASTNISAKFVIHPSIVRSPWEVAPEKCCGQ